MDTQEVRPRERGCAACVGSWKKTYKRGLCYTCWSEVILDEIEDFVSKESRNDYDCSEYERGYVVACCDVLKIIQDGDEDDTN